MVNITEQTAKNIITIIDTVAKRGAFDGSELTAIGAVRDSVANAIKESEKTEVKETEVTNNGN